VEPGPPRDLLAGDVTLFHKNRDNRDRPQCAYVKALKVPGQTIYRFAATEDGLLTMREDERGKMVLGAFQKSRGTITPRLMNRLARTRPVLVDTNISGMTAAIPATHPLSAC